jgi:16S rRNA (guanine527-N7)-methyltransferase
MELLKKYNDLLIRANQVVNLTAHRDPESSWAQNVMDSLLFIDYMRTLPCSKVLDIGSGGGCPAIPLAIQIPNFDITMIDSTQKKVNFLNDTVSQLNLKSARAVHTRIEDFATTHASKFDIVTARGVASLPTLLEYSIPFLRVGGLLLAYKGKNHAQEISESTNALKLLSCEIVQILHAENNDEKDRCLLVIKKLSETPSKYPRGKNLPRLKPL